MANKINPFDPNVNSGLYNVHFPDFAFWLQKTQPLVYDDALSYYEVLCRISAMLNQLIKQVNDLTDAQKKFIEDATKLLNQIISEWNSMVDTWNGWEATFNSWKTQWNQWVQTWNEWSQKIDNWDEQFSNYINQINQLIKKTEEFLTRIENEWNNYQQTINNQINELNTKINNVQGDTTNVNVLVNSVPIKKHGHVVVHSSGSESGAGNTGSMDWQDLIYPEVTIRFISAIISTRFNAHVVGSEGGKNVGTLITDSFTVDDPNYAYLSTFLSNPSFGGASIVDHTKATYFPAVIVFPPKPTANTVFTITVPTWADISEGDSCSFYIYEGGKTQIANTTPDWFKNNVGGI